MTDRNKEIIEMRQQGYTYQAIGNRFDISKARVREIYLNATKEKHIFDHRIFTNQVTLLNLRRITYKLKFLLEP